MKLYKLLPVTLLMTLVGWPAQADSTACYSVDARRGWQYVDLSSTFSRVVSINGSWTTDVIAYDGVGPQGYTGGDEQTTATQYDKNLPLGALIVGVPGTPYSWVKEPQRFEQPVNTIALRINDDVLQDNLGSLRVCFGN